MIFKLRFGKFGLALKFNDAIIAKEFLKRYSSWSSTNCSTDYFAEVSLHNNSEDLKTISIEREGNALKFKLSNFSIYYIPDKKTFKIFIDKSDIKRNPNFFPFLRIPFIIQLNERGGFLFHASSILNNKSSICFPAPSASGKSTIAKLLNQPILNDETSLVSIEGDKAFCFGNKLGGSPDMNFIKSKGELKKFFFIQKAKENEIKDITIEQYLLNLILNDFFMMYFGNSPLLADYLKREFISLARLTKIVKAYELNFNFNIGDYTPLF